MSAVDLLKDLNIDSEETLKRFGNNMDILERFILKFPEDSTFQKLENALEVRDFELVERSAHTLKGLASNLGFSALSQYASACVTAVRENAYSRLPDAFGDTKTEYERIIHVLNEYEKNK